ILTKLTIEVITEVWSLLKLPLLRKECTKVTTKIITKKNEINFTSRPNRPCIRIECRCADEHCYGQQRLTSVLLVNTVRLPKIPRSSQTGAYTNETKKKSQSYMPDDNLRDLENYEQQFHFTRL
ncbi:hypothetical protein Tcan_00926, partial [Toxocara canis]